MNSSTNKLLDCLEILVNTEEVESNLLYPSQIAHNIGERLESIDSNLYYRWMKTKEYYQKIEEEVSDTLKSLYNSILTYSEENLALEESSVKAVNYANDMANEILKDLEL